MTTITISLAFIGLFLLLIFILVAVRVGVSKEKIDLENEEQKPMIHASGIYSVVRKSPKEDIQREKPSEEELRKYMASTNEDYTGRRLDDNDKELLIKSFMDAEAQQIQLIEEGDRVGAEFYFFDFEWIDPVCAKHLRKGQFVTRSDLFRFVSIVPPFHLGCGCRLKLHNSGQKLKDTTEFGLRPFINDDSVLPSLPEWKTTLKIPKG